MFKKVAKPPLLLPRLETTVSIAHQRKIPYCYQQGWEPYSPFPINGGLIHLR